MGFIPVTDLPCTVLNPIPCLDQYLIDINTEDALESFNRLADSLLANQPPCSPLSESEFYSPTSLESSPTNNSQWLSSDPSSPETSELYLSPASSTTSFASHPLSPQSSVSVASSRVGSNLNRRKINSGKRDRRVLNASAAEKYRKKVKGRHGKLLQQMEREQERNNRLKRDLVSKLLLYREFVTLLAENTTQLDRDLAILGSKSLSTILSDAVHQPTCNLDQEMRGELETRLNTFQRILVQSGVIV